MAFNPELILQIAHQVFRDEIAGVQQVASSLNEDFAYAVQLLWECRGKVIVSGMGKSGHIGNKIAATLSSTGTAAFFMHPAEALHGDLGMLDSKDVVIAISYSGESEELTALLPIFKRKQTKVLGITGNPNSTLARLSDQRILIEVAKEACPLNLAPTTSTTATLVIGDALAVALLSLRDFQVEDFALSHPGGNLGRRLLTKVSDIMHSGERLPLVGPEAGIKEIISELSVKGLGLVAVSDESQCLLGIITDADLRMIFDGTINPQSVRAHEIMNRRPKTIGVDALAIDSLAIIDQFKIRALVVVDKANQVVGAFHMHDLFLAKLI